MTNKNEPPLPDTLEIEETEYVIVRDNTGQIESFKEKKEYAYDEAMKGIGDVKDV